MIYDTCIGFLDQTLCRQLGNHLSRDKLPNSVKLMFPNHCKTASQMIGGIRWFTLGSLQLTFALELTTISRNLRNFKVGSSLPRYIATFNYF